MSGINKFLFGAIPFSLLLSGCLLNLEPIATHLTPVKAYGEDWTKPNMTRASWQRDWVACGGRSDGQYTSDAPSGSTSAILIAASEKKKKTTRRLHESQGLHLSLYRECKGT